MSLTQLGYTTKTDGFVFCDDKSQAKNKVEWLYLKECEKFPVQPSAVFFRRFYKNDEVEKPYHSEPSVCIFDVENTFFNSELHKQLHAALWSAGRNEIYVLRSQTRLDILNARKPAAKLGDNDVTLESKDLLLVEKSLAKYEAFKYSTHLFQSGLFWEQDDFKSRIEGNSSPYEFLLSHLLAARKKIHSEVIQHELSKQTIDKLLIISILVKFLEEIKVDEKKHTLNEIYQKHNIESNSFAEVIESHKIFDILDELSKEFNGKIFDQFNKTEKQIIQTIDLQSLAQFLNADIHIPSQQFFIWKQYDFKFLPAEVISSIYENFTGEGEKGVVYTPIHLVNLMIDEVMPLDKSNLFINEDFKILDPACGSGVFLVAAYKRLLQWWFINNEKPIDSETAKRILGKNIFGVDIEETAVLVSIFGLTTTLLDRLSPKEIWNNLEFKDLSEGNIQEANFKDWINNNKKNKEKYFDLIIGNPPFNPSKKGTITAKEFKTLLNKTVPGNKLSLMFLESALYFGKKICMVIPSNSFLYSKSQNNHNYRTQIFTDYTVEKIYDFTHLREELFIKKAIRGISYKKKGRTPVLSLIINNQKSEYQPIEHIVVKRQFQSEQKMRFEIDTYDCHVVPFQKVIDKAKHFVWKTNLLGGGQLFHLIYRLSLLRTLKEFVSNKSKQNKEWLYRSGYKIGGKTKKTKFDYINKGDKIIDVDEKGNIIIDINGEKTDMFESSPSAFMYEPPFIVFDQVLGNECIPTALVKNYKKQYLYFNRDFVGISAPKNQLKTLENIYQLFSKKCNKLYQLQTLVNSGSAMIMTETEINKRDIDSLPFPGNKDYLKLSKTEEFIQNDVLNYYRHLAKAPDGDAKILFQPITKKDKQLKRFGETYCEAMNDIYETETQNWQIGKVTQTPNSTIYRIGFGKKQSLGYQYEKEETDSIFSTLIYDDLQNAGVRFTRVVRYYKHENGFDFVYFIKPNARRYWLNSIALRDAGDTYMDFKKNGY
ncbi:MAG: class I SAM-dependent DNA methyltransferase [Saprospiraceae bacterium]